MTKRLTPTEKHNRHVDRLLDAIRNINCDTISCSDCVLNNYGEQENYISRKYGYSCGKAAIKDAIFEIRKNFKQL